MSETIYVDTREKTGKNDHVTAYFAAHGIKIIRSKLYVGDYQLLSYGFAVVDRKANMAEIYNNLVQGYDRFHAEAKKAFEAGIRLNVLVADNTIHTLQDVKNWENPRAARYNRDAAFRAAQKAPPLSSERLLKRMEHLGKTLGVKWYFAPKADTGQAIMEILNYDKDKRAH